MEHKECNNYLSFGVSIIKNRPSSGKILRDGFFRLEDARSISVFVTSTYKLSYTYHFLIFSEVTLCF